MSQPPPIPPSQPPQYPPTPQATPYGDYVVVPSPPKVSGLAITSLVCSLVLCVPFISGLLGLVFGVAGLFATAGGRRRGRVMAIIGILVSVLSIVVWSILISTAWNKVGPPMMAGTSFFDRARAGDIAGARRFATPEVTDADISALASSPLGQFRGGRNANQQGQQFSYNPPLITLKTVGQFDNGLADIDIALSEANGEWKVSKFKIIPHAASTQPATVPTAVIDFSEKAASQPITP